MSSYPSIDNLLPHDDPMIFLHRVVNIDDISVHCQADVNESNLFFEHDSKGIPAYAGIEFMAQTVAVWSGYHAWKKQKIPPVGFLLGSRRYMTTLSQFDEGIILDVYADQLVKENKMAVFNSRIEHNGQVIVQCQLNVYVPDDNELNSMKKVRK